MDRVSSILLLVPLLRRRDGITLEAMRQNQRQRIQEGEEPHIQSVCCRPTVCSDPFGWTEISFSGRSTGLKWYKIALLHRSPSRIARGLHSNYIRLVHWLKNFLLTVGFLPFRWRPLYFPSAILRSKPVYSLNSFITA